MDSNRIESSIANSKPLKIVIACSQFPPMKSGYARHAYELFTAFQESGNEVQLITENRGCKRKANISFLTEEGKRILNKGHDIVQIIGPSPFFTEQCARYALKKELKVVYSVSALPGLSTYYYNPFAPTIDWMYEKFRLKRTLKNVDLAIFNTEDFASSCTFFRGSYRVIPHGVANCHILDCRNLGREYFAKGNKRQGILFVGQLRRYKGIKYLIRALKRIREIGIDTNLTIVGDGPDATRLRKLARNLGLDNHVLFLGNVSEDRLHEIYASSRLLVLPSIGGESFGIVLLEASAHGLPVVASNLPGVREITWHLGGIPVPPHDSDALARAIIRVLASPLSLPPQAPNDNRHGSTEDPSKISWKTIAQTYLNTYEKLLRGNTEIEHNPSYESEIIAPSQPNNGRNL